MKPVSYDLGELCSAEQKEKQTEELCSYHMCDAEGELQCRCYQVFPGIDLVYEDVHAKSARCLRDTLGTVFEIHHCREGRLEGLSEDELFYMGPGDLAVIQPKTHDSVSHFPLQHYHGVTVTIDIEKAPKCLSCLLEDVDVQPRSLMEKFCSRTGAFVARSKPSIAHVFDELYSVPDCIRTGYLKVKILELMLFLSSIDVGSDELAQRSYSHSQKILAEKVSSYLLTKMETKVTLEQLSETFRVSGSQIKTAIKDVYGTSVYNLIRIQKMQSAAKQLLETDHTILEIAGMHGYDNASKFSAAFKSVMGITPKEYRNAPIKIENLFT